jgi:hypothetical protein
MSFTWFYKLFTHVYHQYFYNTSIIRLKENKCCKNVFDLLIDILNEFHQMYKTLIDISIETTETPDDNDVCCKAYNYWKQEHEHDFSLIKKLFYGLFCNFYKCSKCNYEYYDFETFFFTTRQDSFCIEQKYCEKCKKMQKFSIEKKIIIAPKYIIMYNSTLNFNLSNSLFYETQNYTLSSIIYKQDFYYIICKKDLEDIWIKHDKTGSEYIENIPRNNCVLSIYTRVS